MFDDVIALALHPSGMFMVAVFFNRIRFYNIFPKRIKDYHNINIKNSKETTIKFANGGHLFAA